MIHQNIMNKWKVFSNYINMKSKLSFYIIHVHNCYCAQCPFTYEIQEAADPVIECHFFNFFFRFLGNAVWANMFVNLCRDMKILVSQIPCCSCFLFCIDPPGKNVPGLCCQQSKGEDKSVGAVLQSSSFQSASRTKLYPIVCVFLCRLHLANKDL